MKKALATLAVLAVSCIGSTVFAAHEAADVDRPVVFGNVEVYGAAKLSMDMISTDATGTADTSLNRISSNSSRIGLKGSETISESLSAIYQVEMGVKMDEQGTSPTLRNTYLGLKGGWGLALLGTHDTPYKSSTGSLDPFADTMGDYNAVMGNVSGSNLFDLRAPNVIAYVSPSMAGAQVSVAYAVLGEDDNSKDLKNADAISAAVTYGAGPLFAAAAYEEHNSEVLAGTTKTKVKNTGTKIGAGYAIDATGTKIGLAYEILNDDADNSAITRNALYAAVTQKFDAIAVKLAYGMADDGESTAETGATFLAGGVDYSFSKRTTVYALYAATDNDKGSKYGLGTGQGGAFVPGTGNSPSVISLGINHSF